MDFWIKTARPLYMLLRYVLTSPQMFPTLFKRREIHNFTQGNAAALTSGSESDSEEGSWLTRLTRGNKVKKHSAQNVKLYLVTVVIETSFLLTETLGFISSLF